MKCANCGNPMNDGDRFCMMCGFKAAEASVEAAPVEMPSVAPVEAPVAAPAFEAPAAPAFDAPVETPATASFEAPVAAPAEAPVAAPAFDAPVESAPVAPMEDRLPEPPPFNPGSSSLDPVAEDRLPEPPPFNPGSSEVTGEPAYQPEVAQEFTQPEAPAEPVMGVASVPVVGGTDTAPFSSNTGLPAPAPAPEAPKTSLEDMFQRKSWKDEGVNNGGIVNRGPK